MMSLLLYILLAAPVTAQSLPHYPQYPGRAVQNLAGKWDFVMMYDYDLNVTSAAKIKFNRTQQVPSAWDAAWGTGIQYSRGTGFYHKDVQIPAHKDAMLHFEACSLWCRVLVDDVVLAEINYGGFTPFWVRVPPSEKSTRHVVVVADNRFSKDRTPTQYAYYDFYQYGGIIRDVTLHVLPSTHIQRVEISPLTDPKCKTKSCPPSGQVSAKVVLGGAFTAGERFKFAVQFDADGGIKEFEGQVDAKGVMVKVLDRVFSKDTFWSPSAPNLHTATIALKDEHGFLPMDAVQVRFGVRTVGTDGRSVTINGEPIKLKGFNRHDMYPYVGPTLPKSQYLEDLKIFQSMNANFIRGCHYPQDQLFLDLCDEKGLLVWNEALAWGNYLNVLTDPRFMAAEVATANAMVDSSVNHPSVILWGFFNEGQSEIPNATASYATMAKTFKSRDPTRLVTWASNRMNRDKGFKYADVISFNNYPGWYNGPASTIVQQWTDHATWVKQNWPTKPFIISETGAGGIVGNHSHNESRWSEEYQEEVDSLAAGVAMNNSDIAGIALWQFTDIKVDQLNTSTNRPGGINNKGVFSRWRKPKVAAAAIRDIFGHK